MPSVRPPRDWEQYASSGLSTGWTVRDLLKDEAKRIGVTEAAVIRAAIGEYLGRRGY